MKQPGIIHDLHEYGLNIERREIFLHSYVDNVEEEPGVDYRSAIVFLKNITLLDAMTDKPISIHMFSIGGEWEAGMAMYDAISSCKSYVTVHVHGQASSMSSIILQAADFRVMMPNSHYMCHFGSQHYGGHYLNYQAVAKLDREWCKIMIDIYAEKMVHSQFFKEKHPGGDVTKAYNFIKRKLKDGDWYLTPEETVYYGFADCVWGDRKFKATMQ